MIVAQQGVRDDMAEAKRRIEGPDVEVCQGPDPYSFEVMFRKTGRLFHWWPRSGWFNECRAGKDRVQGRGVRNMIEHGNKERSQ